jgi:hypothetical protein
MDNDDEAREASHAIMKPTTHDKQHGEATETRPKT